jgi:hypothetical protein
LPRDAVQQKILHATIRMLLRTIKAAARPVPLCAVSSLAEGADRVFAEEALVLGYAILCPMPFTQAEFEKDFLAPAALEPQSLAQFRALLDTARQGPGLRVMELDGARAQAPAAYAAAGHAVLDQSHLLVAVWDGGEAAGQGGTSETLREGLRRHIPVLWVNARAPENWTLLRGEADLTRGGVSSRQGQETAVAELVRALLAG